MNDDSDQTKVIGKASRVNDNSADERDEPNPPAPATPRADTEPNKVEGNALRVNDNSVKGEASVLRQPRSARNDGACKQTEKFGVSIKR
ncbi:hypothetical protein [Mesorhizobium huakuii]|uniref:Uncharacterized protein n=1 Tax=Mesorhizobium huakuii TaxID=28104 RepID=A0ABZ0VV28_9HYPH|nr:hypothetical protein [Mesorhizobium huakuii]WQC01131.1 hypothetical protein U0R22_005347 [Mesorhizobium huakuii]